MEHVKLIIDQTSAMRIMMFTKKRAKMNITTCIDYQ